MNLEHATPDLFAALAAAQGEIENATKRSANPHFKSKYADLAEVLTTIRETFPKHGLSLTQAPSFDGSLASVHTVVGHKLGGYITSVASCVPAKSDGQGIGAATTYLRRQSAAAMAGIAQEDDDGNSAAHDRKPEPVGRPTDGVWEALDASTQGMLQQSSATLREYIEGDDMTGAVEYLERLGLGTDEKAGLWTLLKSNERSAIKKAIEAKKDRT